MTSRREAFEARIEALVVPHVERVRAGESVPLGRLCDLYPNHQDYDRAPEGENCVWSAALEDITSRHGVTCAIGWIYPIQADGSIAADISPDLQLFLEPAGFHGPKEENEPDPAERHLNRGMYFWRSECIEEALEELREAIRLKPAWTRAYEALARVLCYSGQLEAGLEVHREAIRLDPTDPNLYSELGFELLHRVEKPADAIEVYREGLRVDPAWSELHCQLALALSDVGQNEEAITEYREGLRLDSEEVGCRVNLGHLLCEAGRLEEALSEYEEAYRLNPAYTDLAELICETREQIRAAT
jgi:tetratricopeptide (TPR) repeat protein